MDANIAREFLQNGYVCGIGEREKVELELHSIESIAPEEIEEWVECEEEVEYWTFSFLIWRIVLAMIAITLVAAFFYLLEKRKQNTKPDEKLKKKSKSIIEKEISDEHNFTCTDQYSKLLSNDQSDVDPLISNDKSNIDPLVSADQPRIDPLIMAGLDFDKSESIDQFPIMTLTTPTGTNEFIFNCKSPDDIDVELPAEDHELTILVKNLKLTTGNCDPITNGHVNSDDSNLDFHQLIENCDQNNDLNDTSIDNRSAKMIVDKDQIIDTHFENFDQNNDLNDSSIDNRSEKILLGNVDKDQIINDSDENDHVNSTDETGLDFRNLIESSDQTNPVENCDQHNDLNDTSLDNRSEKMSLGNIDNDQSIDIHFKNFDQKNDPNDSLIDNQSENLIFENVDQNEAIDTHIENFDQNNDLNETSIDNRSEKMILENVDNKDQITNDTDENDHVNSNGTGLDFRKLIENSDQTNSIENCDQHNVLIYSSVDNRSEKLILENVVTDDIDENDHISIDVYIPLKKPETREIKEEKVSSELHGQLILPIIQSSNNGIDKESSDLEAQGGQHSSEEQISLAENTTAPEIETFEASDIENDQDLSIDNRSENADIQDENHHISIGVDKEIMEESSLGDPNKQNGIAPVIMSHILTRTTTPTYRRRCGKLDDYDQSEMSNSSESDINNGSCGNNDEEEEENAKISSVFEVIGAKNMDEALIKMETLEAVTRVMRLAGLENSNLIFGIDYTASNKYQGEISFNGESLHKINDNRLNPYQQVITIMGQTLAPFAKIGCIPAFGFGDIHTSDTSIFPLKSDGYCGSFAEVLQVYNEITPKVILSGPTNFAPLIYQSIEICREFRCYHILVIVADGQVTNERATRRAIVQACMYPLSIIVVGVGDGPWDMMKVFDDNLPKRPWDNFHFIEFYKVTSDAKQPDLSFAMQALIEIPDQYKKIKSLGLLNFD